MMGKVRQGLGDEVGFVRKDDGVGCLNVKGANIGTAQGIVQQLGFDWGNPCFSVNVKFQETGVCVGGR